MELTKLDGDRLPENRRSPMKDGWEKKKEGKKGRKEEGKKREGRGKEGKGR